jgi:hypothetical protein
MTLALTRSLALALALTRTRTLALRDAGYAKQLLHAQYLHRESIYVVQRLLEQVIDRGLPFMYAHLPSIQPLRGTQAACLPRVC